MSSLPQAIDQFKKDAKTGVVTNADDAQYKQFIEKRAMSKKIRSLEERLAAIETNVSILQKRVLDVG